MRRVVLDPARLRRLQQAAVVVPAESAVFRITGPGALACLQGLLTSDLERPGDDSLVYGAMLTPKGAIVADGWMLRRPAEFLFVLEEEARAVTADLLRRSLPPRLARAQDVSPEQRVLWLMGEAIPRSVELAGLPPLPEPGRLVLADGLTLAAPPGPAPFRALVTGSGPEVERVRSALLRHGAAPGDEADRDAARILAGWPRLGAEIGERTLVQEVRFDEIGGVSYTKGCYTGQETVARLHFRGHTNRELRGLLWADGAEPATGTVVSAEGRELGQVGSVLSFRDRHIGLAVLRREVETGATVEAGGATARVIPLPVDPALASP